MVLLFFALASFSMHVATPARASAQSAENASGVIAQARRVLDAGRPDEAIDQLKRAYQVSGDPVFLFELGEVNREVGRNGEAIKFYQAYIRRQPNGPRRATAESMIAALQAEPRTHGSAARPGASAPEPRPSQPQPQVTVSSAQPSSVTAPAVAPPSPAPPAAPPIAEVPAGAELSVSTTSEPGTKVPAADSPVPWWLPWVGVAATAGVGAAAVVAGTRANQRYDELAGSCRLTDAGCSDAEIDSVKSRARTANILWALTAAAGVGTGILFIINVSSAGVSGVWRF